MTECSQYSEGSGIIEWAVHNIWLNWTRRLWVALVTFWPSNPRSWSISKNVPEPKGWAQGCIQTPHPHGVDCGSLLMPMAWPFFFLLPYIHQRSGAVLRLGNYVLVPASRASRDCLSVMYWLLLFVWFLLVFSSISDDWLDPDTPWENRTFIGKSPQHQSIAPPPLPERCIR